MISAPEHSVSALGAHSLTEKILPSWRKLTIYLPAISRLQATSDNAATRRSNSEGGL